MVERGNRTAWIAAISAYVLWGLMPLYWRLFVGTPPFVVFLHRCLWSFPFLVLFSVVKRDPDREVLAMTLNRLPWLVISGLLIGANWWIYIVGVAKHQVLEMSLGYFFAPLLSAFLGVVVLRERLTWGQWAGVAAVFGGVAFYSLNIGHMPMMAIGLGLTFSLYGLIRKMVRVAPLTALTTESMILFILAVIYLFMSPSDSSWNEAWSQHKGLLIFSGVMTAMPLLWFAAASRGLTMTTLGMLNYISPTGKFLLATLVFGEIVAAVDLWAFGVIWMGILVYLAFTYKRQKSLLQPE